MNDDFNNDDYVSYDEWKSADERETSINRAKRTIMRVEEERKRKGAASWKKAEKRKKIGQMGLKGVVAVAGLAVVITIMAKVIPPSMKYREAVKDAQNGNYEKAIDEFKELGDYRDSELKILETRYDRAVSEMKAGDYVQAYSHFVEIYDYYDAEEQANICLIRIAEKYVMDGEYSEAIRLLEKVQPSSYSAMNEKIETMDDAYYHLALEAYEAGYTKTAYEYVAQIEDTEPVQEFVDGVKADYAKVLNEEENYSEAQKLLEEIADPDVIVTNSELYEIYMESTKGVAVALTDEERYDDALSELDKLYSEDAEEDVLEVKYRYVSTEGNRLDSKTASYLDELLAADYKDSAELEKEIYKWKISFANNTSQGDYKNSDASISKYMPVYVHIQAYGGKPGEKLHFYYEYEMNDYSGTNAWDNAWESGTSGYIGWDTPFMETGTLHVRVYDNDGNKLGETSVEIVE